MSIFGWVPNENTQGNSRSAVLGTWADRQAQKKELAGNIFIIKYCNMMLWCCQNMPNYELEELEQSKKKTTAELALIQSRINIRNNKN